MYNIGVGSDSLGVTLGAHLAEGRVNKVDVMKINFASKVTVNIVKIQPTGWEKTSANDISDKD